LHAFEPAIARSRHTLERLRRRSPAIGECVTGNNVNSTFATQSLPHECFVLKVDGRVKSQHRRLVDALRAGWQLKDQFPQHDIKVGALGHPAPTRLPTSAFSHKLKWRHARSLSALAS
jgi:hypothetical protein